MDYRRWLKEAMRRHQIRASVLSRESGVQERQISLFFSGKDLMTSTFFKLVDAMERLAPGSLFPATPAEDLEIAEQLSDLAEKLKRKAHSGSNGAKVSDEVMVVSG